MRSSKNQIVRRKHPENKLHFLNWLVSAKNLLKLLIEDKNAVNIKYYMLQLLCMQITHSSTERCIF